MVRGPVKQAGRAKDFGKFLRRRKRLEEIGLCSVVDSNALSGYSMSPELGSESIGETETTMIRDFTSEYARYRNIGEKAISQVSDEALNEVLGADNNSIAIIVRHISGNLLSRFTDFLNSDGEKPWRNRDSEFQNARYDRREVVRMWTEGWAVLESELSKLCDDQLQQHVYIRGQSWTVHDALCRSLAHVSYHVGQIVLLARILSAGNWQWISIPKGRSHEYNLNPTKEKKP